MPVKYGNIMCSEQSIENNPISKIIDLEIVDICGSTSTKGKFGCSWKRLVETATYH